MTTELGDGWKLFEGVTKYPKPCAVCGQIVAVDPVYRGRLSMHKECFNDWNLHGRPTLAAENPQETAANALRSDSPKKYETTYQSPPKTPQMSLDDVVVALFDISKAIREQTEALLKAEVK